MTRLSVKTQKLCLAGMLSALGVVLPWLFHLFGLGTMFVPLHISVFVAAILLGPFYGILVAVISVFANFLILGMPPLEILPFILIELVGYAVFSGLFCSLIRKSNIFVYVGYFTGAIAGRAFLFGVYMLFTEGLPLVGLDPLYNTPASISVWTSLTTAWPGVALQIIVVPLLVILAKKVTDFEKQY